MYDVRWSDESLGAMRRMLEIGNRMMRGQVTSAVQAIDDKLKSEPLQQGESRSPGRRIMFEGPLGVLFQVDFRQQLVSIEHIWPIYWYV